MSSVWKDRARADSRTWGTSVCVELKSSARDRNVKVLYGGQVETDEAMERGEDFI